jgi:CBS domain-containing protein
MTAEPHLVGERTPIAECASVLVRHGHRHLPMVGGAGDLTGLLTDFGVFQHGASMGAEPDLWVPFEPAAEHLTASDIAEPAHVVARADEAAVAVLRRLADDPQDVAIVVDEQDRPIGILTEHDGVRMAQGMTGSGMDAATAGTRPVHVVDARASAQAAWSTVIERRVRHVVVMDGDTLYGVISYRDLVEDNVGGGREIDCRSVVRNTKVITAPPQAPIHEVARLMAESRVGCVPVTVGRGVPEAVVTRTDIIRLLVDALERGNHLQT